MPTAAAHLSPAASRAIGRFVGLLIRELGYGWGALAALGLFGAGWAAWTLPTWWPWMQDQWDKVLDWLDE